MERVPATVLAYLAGVIDSDGFVGVQRQAKRGRLYFGVRVGITGTRRQPHDLAAATFGGNVTEHDGNFQWMRTGRSAPAVLVAVRPYLRVKARQADLALALQAAVVAGATVSDLETATAELRALNVRRGRAVSHSR
jgi:hypothetical protein